MINPVWLNTFVRLIDVGHFTRAAEQLAMTQPGVSQHVSKLENHFECALIQRQGKRFELTSAGQEVYQFACTWLLQAKALERQLKNDSPYEGGLRLAAPGALSLVLYPQLVALQAEHRQLIVNFEVAPNRRIINDVLENRVDVGWITQNPDNSGLLTALCGNQSLSIITEAGMKSESWDVLLALGFINHPDGLHHASLVFEQNMGDRFAGIEQLKVTGNINQLGQILDPVAAGLGFTVLPAPVVESYSHPQRLRVFSQDNPVYESIYRIQKKHRTLPSRYQYMIERVDLPVFSLK